MSISIAKETHLNFDWVLVLAYGTGDDEVKERTHIIKALKAAGLVPVLVKSKTGNLTEAHIWVRCPIERLEIEAEKKEVMKPLQEKGGLAPFSKTKRHHFKSRKTEEAFFSSFERQHLIYSIMTSPNSLQGAALDFEKMKSLGYLIEVMPLHDLAKRNELIQKWLSTPIYKIGLRVEQYEDDIKDYFGEDVALYFLWAGHFVRCFLPLACLGVACQIAQAVIKYGVDTSQGIGEESLRTLNVVTAAYAFVMHVFIATYTASWARRQYGLAYQWGVINLKPDFKELAKGQPSIDMTTLQRFDENSNAADIATDFKRVIRWVTVLIQLVLLSIMLAGAATLTVALRVARDTFMPIPLSLGNTVLFAVAEAARSLAFQILGAQALAVLEPVDAVVFLVPSAKQSWQDAKRSLFDLVNNNLCLLYIACTSVWGYPSDFSWPATCYLDDCMMDMQVNLWALVISKVTMPFCFSLFWSMVKLSVAPREQSAPSLSSASKTKGTSSTTGASSDRRTHSSAPLQRVGGAGSVFAEKSQAETERDLPEFQHGSGAHTMQTAYAEICPLVSQVIIFGVSAPASIGLLILIVQLKMKYDSYKLLKHSRRPIVRRANSTGTAEKYLTVIMTLANIVIPTLLFFVFDDIQKELLGPPDCPIQYVCFTDSARNIRYNSTLPDYRWRVHPSDSNKHWLTWTVIVGMGLALRLLSATLLRNPSYHIRARTNEQRFVQMNMGLAMSIQDPHQQAANTEDFEIAYKQLKALQSEKISKWDSTGMSSPFDDFDKWPAIRPLPPPATSA